MSIRFTKLQGAGNDFVLVADKVDYDWARLAMAMCDRHYGIGADGLLVLLPSSKADFRMRIFNPDGSEAETCGNGLRCFARYILENRLIRPEADSILVETLAGTRTIRFRRSNKGKTAIQASMGSRSRSPSTPSPPRTMSRAALMRHPRPSPVASAPPQSEERIHLRFFVHSKELQKKRLPSLGAAWILVPAVGIELTTYRLQGGCSTN